MRKIAFAVLGVFIVCTAYSMPLAGAVFLFQLTSGSLQRLFVCLLIPLVVTILFVLVTGLWSMPFQRYIVPGKFPRKLDHPMYFGRRVYGLCWTALYYCTPVYSLCLSIMPLKWLTFRLFGYRGSMNFAIYPDTWICDLPLLNFGDGAYLSNKATLGTNIALSNGFILVDHIILEKGAYVGHLSMLAPGVHMGVNSEVGVGCGIGIKTKIGECARIGPATSLERGVSIGARVNVGSMSYIGTRSTLTEGLSIPASCLIPAKTILQKQHEVCHFVSSINKTVPVLAMSLALGLARWNGDRQSIKEECASI